MRKNKVYCIFSEIDDSQLISQLEKAGVVGAALGAKPREVLIHDEYSLNNLLASLR